MNPTDNATAVDRPIIDPSLIPEYVRKDIGRVGLQAVINYYKNPENERRFKEWLVGYRERQAKKGGSK